MKPTRTDDTLCSGSPRDLTVPAMALRCGCSLHARRLFTGGLLAAATLPASMPAWARKVDPPIDPTVACKDFGKVSVFVSKGASAELEAEATRQYIALQGEASSKKALVARDHPQMVRLQYIADRMIPFTKTCNARASSWKWDISLLNSPQVNAFCMPGGKIAFFAGILVKLQLSDDEVAAIMGHEIAHALREHANERRGKGVATNVLAGVASVASAIFLGTGAIGDAAIRGTAQLTLLKFSRSDETEADLLGAELSARAGYDPAAGVTLWQKMMEANKNAPPQWMSTHPSGKTRIKDIQTLLPRVAPLYAAAPKPPQSFGPPPKSSTGNATPAPQGARS
jgi:predicted Zn-dependent protease